MANEKHRYTLTLDGRPPDDLGRMCEQSARLIVALRLSQTSRRVTWGPMGWTPTGLDGVDVINIYAWTEADNVPRYCGELRREVVA